MSEMNPRHSIKARRKQREETLDIVIPAPFESHDIIEEIDEIKDYDNDNDDDDDDASQNDHNNHNNHNNHNSNNSNNNDNSGKSNNTPEPDSEWRRRYEAAVRKRRSPTNNHQNNNYGSTPLLWSSGNHSQSQQQQQPPYHSMLSSPSSSRQMTNLSPLSNKSTSTSQADMEFILATSMDTMEYPSSSNHHPKGDYSHQQQQQQPQNHHCFHEAEESCSPSPTSKCSADSIIRRVEAEIAAARKSAAMAKHNQYYNNNHPTNALPQQQQQQPHRTRGLLGPNNDNDNDDHDSDDPTDDEVDLDMAQILNTTNTFSDHQHHSTNDGTNSPSIASSADSSKRRALDLIHDEFRTTSPSSRMMAPGEDNGVTPDHVEFYPIRQQQPLLPLPVVDTTTNGTWQDSTGSNSNEYPTAAAATKTITQPQAQAPPNSFLVNLCQATKDMVTIEDAHFHPFEEKKEETTVTSNGSTSNTHNDNYNPILSASTKEINTPTRSNRHAAAAAARDSESIRNELNHHGTIEPDGVYQQASTPPRHSEPQVASVIIPLEDQKQDGTNDVTATIVPTLRSTTPTTSFMSQQQRTSSSSSMDKTRELLDSLKEQRQSLQKSPMGRNSPQQQQHLNSNNSNSNSSPRFNTFFKPTPRSVNSSNNSTNHDLAQPPHVINGHGYRESVDMIGSNRSNSAFPLPPPSPSSARNKRAVFPEEVYELVKESGHENNETNNSPAMSSDQSRRIRFRNPFPLLKPPIVGRPLEEMIHDHAMDIPDIPVRWLKPKQELKQLIVAAMGTSLPRRSNACGALKVLTRQKENQMSLVRTDGFLQAITYAASQSVLDVDTLLAIDARTRAVSCFKNVCHPKDNRILILNHPGVIECLLKVVQLDDGAGRATAAAAIALLAKTPQCRECLVHVEGLVDTLAEVMHSASTMISEEAMAVRNSSPRSGSNNSFLQQQHPFTKTLSARDENYTNVNGNTPNMKKLHAKQNDLDSPLTESSSLSSGEGGNNNDNNNDLMAPESPSKAATATTNNGEMITLIGSKLYNINTVDSIRNQTDERYEEFVNQARCNACAALLHLSKQCATSVRFLETRTNVVLFTIQLESTTYNRNKKLTQTFPFTSFCFSLYRMTWRIIIPLYRVLPRSLVKSIIRYIQSVWTYCVTCHGCRPTIRY
jgi:hypothetical protein